MFPGVPGGLQRNVFSTGTRNLLLRDFFPFFFGFAGFNVFDDLVNSPQVASRVLQDKLVELLQDRHVAERP